MFATKDEARVALTDWLERIDHPDPADVLEAILGALIPAIGFAPILADTDSIGTRIGGVPDVASGFDWPIRAKPDSIDDFAFEGAGDDEHISRYASRAFPMQFLAQVDLAELAALPGKTPLPAVGRLLFFYDLAAGPWHIGPSVVSVIHDTAPASQLAPAPPPAAFAEMEELEREAVLAMPNDYGFSREQLLGFVPSFLHPSRPMGLRSVLQLPPWGSLELDVNAPLNAMLESTEPLGESLFDAGYFELTDEGRKHHFMFGAPFAEQDDPRYDAVESTEEGRTIRPRHGDNWQAAFAEIKPLAPAWNLLLQIDVADLQQRSAEGTVYFLIRTEDLAAQAFDKTVAIYQQT